MNYKIPYLVGNRTPQDHTQLGIIDSADPAAEPIRFSISLAQLMALAWRIKEFTLTGQADISGELDGEVYRHIVFEITEADRYIVKIAGDPAHVDNETTLISASAFRTVTHPGFFIPKSSVIATTDDLLGHPRPDTGAFWRGRPPDIFNTPYHLTNNPSGSAREFISLPPADFFAFKGNPTVRMLGDTWLNPLTYDSVTESFGFRINFAITGGALFGGVVPINSNTVPLPGRSVTGNLEIDLGLGLPGITVPCVVNPYPLTGPDVSFDPDPGQEWDYPFVAAINTHLDQTRETKATGSFSFALRATKFWPYANSLGLPV